MCSSAASAIHTCQWENNPVMVNCPAIPKSEASLHIPST